MYIYILRLSTDDNNTHKYYVGKTVREPKIRFQEHISGYKEAAWIHKYPIVYKWYFMLFKINDNKYSGIEDLYKYHLMAKYGIDNVRGGSFCELVLSVIAREFILGEIDSILDCCRQCYKTGHKMSACPNCSICFAENDENIIYKCNYKNIDW